MEFGSSSRPARYKTRLKCRLFFFNRLSGFFYSQGLVTQATSSHPEGLTLKSMLAENVIGKSKTYENKVLCEVITLDILPKLFIRLIWAFQASAIIRNLYLRLLPHGLHRERDNYSGPVQIWSCHCCDWTICKETNKTLIMRLLNWLSLRKRIY